MSNGIDNGGPIAAGMTCVDGVLTPNGGLSIRDYFAAQAMMGLLGASLGLVAVASSRILYAEIAYALADEMIKERGAA